MFLKIFTNISCVGAARMLPRFAADRQHIGEHNVVATMYPCFAGALDCPFFRVSSVPFAHATFNAIFEPILRTKHALPYPTRKVYCKRSGGLTENYYHILFEDTRNDARDKHGTGQFRTQSRAKNFRIRSRKCKRSFRLFCSLTVRPFTKPVGRGYRSRRAHRSLVGRIPLCKIAQYSNLP